MKRFTVTVKTLIQRLVIALQFFSGNGLANHAAAGAYGFLLSAAPILLLASVFLLFAFRSSPQTISILIKNIPFLDIVFDEQWLNNDFLNVSRPGISGVISALSIFGAGSILAVSMQRGLKIIFTGGNRRNPLFNYLLVLGVEALALIFVLAMVFSSRTALRFFEAFDFVPKTSLLYFIGVKLRTRVFRVIVLGLISYCAYRFIPANPPRRLSALWGTVLCVCAFECVTLALGILPRQQRFNFLYGGLGSLVVLLINVYFFFLLFFLGAQLALVNDYFDAFLLMKLRQCSNADVAPQFKQTMMRRLFLSVDGSLRKYRRCYRKGEIIFKRGESGSDIYYLFEGEVEVLIQSEHDTGIPADILGPGSFAGEMSYLLSENRSATIRAKTDITALALPPWIFDTILKYDADLDRSIIEYLSRRIKDRNEQIAGGTNY